MKFKNKLYTIITKNLYYSKAQTKLLEKIGRIEKNSIFMVKQNIIDKKI